MVNAMMLSHNYRFNPEFDDRVRYKKRIGLDIDDVLCDFMKPWFEIYGSDEIQNWLQSVDKDDNKKKQYNPPIHFNFSYEIKQKLDTIPKKELEQFYSELPKINAVPFEPICYITSRKIDNSITEKWLEKNKYPTVPVVGNSSKVDINNIEIFVDDNYKNYCELNNAGICCYLFDAPHN